MTVFLVISCLCDTDLLEALSGCGGGHSPVLALLPWLRNLKLPAFVAASFVVLNRWVREERQGTFQTRTVRVLATLGLMSYSTYLVHLPILRLTDYLMPLDHSLAATGLRLALYVPLCLGCAALFFVVVERRFLNPSAARPVPSLRSAGQSVEERCLKPQAAKRETAYESPPSISSSASCAGAVIATASAP